MQPFEVFDDILTGDEILGIERVMRQPFFPWYMQEYTAAGSCNDQRYQDVPFLSHTFINQGNESSFSGMAKDIVKKFSERSCLEFTVIDRAIGAATIKSNVKYTTPPHVDIPIDHRVLLYYVNGSDGQTILYKKDTDFEELARVDCKAGRFLLFDGSYYHSALTCTNNNYRIIINFNLL